MFERFIKPVYAHCDVPCGIYETDTMTHAAATCKKCKDQLYLLWSDYFKPEHLEKFPDLHDKFWKATKQCGAVKQHMSIEECDKLIDMVHDISHMFADATK